MATTTKLAAPPPDDDPTPIPTSVMITHTETSTTTTAVAWGNWVYAGPARIYTNVPVTVTNGTVIYWPGNPGGGDGSWTPTDEPVNTRPDNYRPEPTEAEAAQLRGDDTSEEG